MRFIAILAMICGWAYIARSQVLEQPTRRTGDATLRSLIEVQTRKIYESAKQPVFLLRRSGPSSLKGWSNMEVAGYYVSGELARIVVTAWHASGKHGLEYYMQSGRLLQIYENF